MHFQNNTTKGIYFALITAFISGVANYVNKFAVTAIQPPLIFTAVKNTGVGLLIIALLLVLGKWKQLKKVQKREWVYLILIGIIGGSVPFYLFFTGLSQIPAINAALIHKTLVIWVALLAIPLLKEKLSPLQIFAVTLLFGSNLIIGGFKGFHYSTGEMYVLFATMFWAVENILAKKILPKVDPDILTSARMGFGSIILLAASWVSAPTALQNSLSLNSTQWFWLILTMATLLGYVATWYRALKLAPATTVTAILVAGTLVTNLLTVIFETHTLNPVLAIQSGLVILGVALFWLSSKLSARKTSQNLLCPKQ